jgi:hypothetical protein
MVSGYDDGPVSPELVLVDPALRVQLEMRESVLLGEPLPAAEVPAPTDVSEFPNVSSPSDGSVGDAPLLAEGVVRADNAGHVPTRSTARRLLLMVAVAAALFATAGSWVFVGLVLSGDRASVFGVAATTPPPPPSPPQAAATPTAKPASPAVATQPTISRATTTTPTVAAQAGARASASSRVFAWAPVANAERYTFEITRNGKSVFSVTTSAPRISVPTHWRHAGRNMTLSPGRYQWYVWPVVRSGTTTQTSTTAIVASNLDIAP